jgi:hypothetical protein
VPQPELRDGECGQQDTEADIRCRRAHHPLTSVSERQNVSDCARMNGLTK